MPVLATHTHILISFDDTAPTIEINRHAGPRRQYVRIFWLEDGHTVASLDLDVAHVLTETVEARWPPGWDRDRGDVVEVTRLARGGLPPP